MKADKEKLAKVVFINQDSGYLMIDIINSYAECGYSCILITGRLVERNTPLQDTVKVDQIIRYDRTTILRRILTWVIGFIQIWLKVTFKYRKYGLFIVSNPPIAPLLPLIVKNPFQLLIFDVYPDVLVYSGYLSESSILIRLWKKSNLNVFAKSKTIFTISESMAQVLQTYSIYKKVEIVPIWTDNTFLKPVDPLSNPFLQKHKLTGKFIVMYSGNIGLSGDADILIEIASEIKRDDIFFLIIGEGAKKEAIINKTKALDLKNLLILPWQSIDELPFSLSSASLAVVFSSSRTSKLAVPSKLYNFLSVGAPLLCLTSNGSEVDNLTKKYEFGRSFEPDDINGIINFINAIADDIELHNVMKLNSLRASLDFSKGNVSKFHIASSFV